MVSSPFQILSILFIFMVEILFHIDYHIKILNDIVVHR